MPTKAAKRLSPLDNVIWHEWKDKVRQHSPLNSSNIVSHMMTAYHSVSVAPNLYYRHFELTDGQSMYKDSPSPSVHHHTDRVPAHALDREENSMYSNSSRILDLYICKYRASSTLLVLYIILFILHTVRYNIRKHKLGRYFWRRL